MCGGGLCSGVLRGIAIHPAEPGGSSAERHAQRNDAAFVERYLARHEEDP
jgi:hypothetical protein